MHSQKSSAYSLQTKTDSHKTSFVKTLANLFGAKKQEQELLNASEIQKKGQKLQTPFNIYGTQNQIEAMTKLVNRICDGSKFGQEILENASKSGVTLTLAKATGNVAGVFDDETKTISISEKSANDLQLTTLLHEARHAEQYMRGIGEITLETASFETNLKAMRLKEADAVSCSIAVAYDLGNTGDTAPLQHVQKHYKKSVDLYTSVLDNNSNDLSGALCVAAQSWYKSDKKEIYELYALNVLGNAFDEGIAPVTTEKKLSTNELTSKLCVYGNNNYFKNSAHMLDTGEFKGVSKTSKEWLLDHTKACAVVFGKIDPSIDLLPVYESHTPSYAYPLPEKKSKSKIVAVALKAQRALANKNR